MTFVTMYYSDILRFFSRKSHHFFSNVFQTVSGRLLRYATVISNLRLYQTITDVLFVRSIMIQHFTCNERFDEFKILRIWDKNENFIVFHFLGKQSEIEHRLHRLS